MRLTQVRFTTVEMGSSMRGQKDGRAQAPVLQRGGSLIHDDSASCGGDCCSAHTETLTIVRTTAVLSTQVAHHKVVGSKPLLANGISALFCGV